MYRFPMYWNWCKHTLQRTHKSEKQHLKQSLLDLCTLELFNYFFIPPTLKIPFQSQSQEKVNMALLKWITDVAVLGKWGLIAKGSSGCLQSRPISTLWITTASVSLTVTTKKGQMVKKQNTPENCKQWIQVLHLV